LKEAPSDGFDGEAAAADYLAMAKLASGWGQLQLALRFNVAAAIMLDEYCGSPGRAIEALDAADESLGPSPATARARAKVRWRMNDHVGALAEFHSVRQEDMEDSVERTHMAREAGISAAQIGSWAEAAIWFQRGRDHARSVEGDLMLPAAIGLGADEAQARYLAGDRETAIRLYARALRELRKLDPEASLEAAHCHRLVRHAVLWLLLEAGGARNDPDDPIVLPPGACSNPDPKKGIEKVPLADLDMAWYLLADAELSLGLPPTVEGRLRAELRGEPVLAYEVTRPKHRLDRAIAEVDGELAGDQLMPLAGSAQIIAARRDELMASDPRDPMRGELPRVILDGSEDPAIRRKVLDAVIAFGISAALAGRPDEIRRMLNAMDDDLSGVRGLVRIMAGGESLAPGQDEMVAEAVGLVGRRRPVEPTEALAATMRFVLFAAHSEYRKLLEAPLATWVREAWDHILEEHRFRLVAPELTASAISARLDRFAPSLAWAAGLALDALAATRASLLGGARDQLQKIALQGPPAEGSNGGIEE
jgi:tetratricopeptide (TPR) repeat protein